VPTDSASKGTLEQQTADTLATAAAREAAMRDVAAADSALAEARTLMARPGAVRQSAPPDPRLPPLDAALAAARSSRAVGALLALADEEAVRYGPRMQATAESLRTSTDPAETARLANTIIAMAQYRRNAIAAERAQAEPVVLGEVAPDTTALVAGQGVAREALGRAGAAHEAAVAAYRRTASALNGGRAPVPPLSPGLLVIGIVLAGFALRIGLALAREMQEPRLAHIVEAEHAVGAPVLTLVRDALPYGPLRFRPTGVDPFRVLYLGLTATGTRARSLIVTGADPVIVAAVAARLALAAAADHRTTLVAELDPTQIALARIFRDHPEPGFTDARAGAFKWREVARPVGSSDGLSIAMIPAGTERDPVTDVAALDAARASFSTFREGFEFTIVTATTPQLGEARALLAGAPIVLCATVGETPVARFTEDGAGIQQDGVRLHSVVLWDAPRPLLPSRAELAAHLSKRKGRTPGGSFKAVQEATKKPV
jgi:Mrp family chromosome partitioning ATPase